MDGSCRIIAVRHGETAWNREGRLQGHQDIPLNERGLAQAEAVALALADEDVDAIYASDLQRAARTAAAIAHRQGLAVRTDGGLRERAFGEFEGCCWPELEARRPEDCARWKRREPDFAPPGGGESLLGFQVRCVGAVEALARRHPGGSIVVVAHGGVLDCLYRAATRQSIQATRTWALGNATINRLIHSAGGLSLVGWNDDLHLSALSVLDESA